MKPDPPATVRGAAHSPYASDEHVRIEPMTGSIKGFCPRGSTLIPITGAGILEGVTLSDEDLPVTKV